jgi:hypothetical protein
MSACTHLCLSQRLLRTGACAALTVVAALLPPSLAAQTQTSADALIAWTFENHCDNGGGFFLANYLTGDFLETPGLEFTTTGLCVRDDASQWSLSRNGRYLAFTSAGNVRLYDRVNEEMVPLPFNTAAFRESEPSLTGSGSFVAYSTNQTGTGNVKLFDRAAASNAPLPGLNTQAFVEKQPSISGGAALIAFTSNRNGDWDIFLYDRSLHHLVALPGLNRRGLDDTEPSISGDGNLIAFTADKKGGSGAAFIRLYSRTTQSFVHLPGIHDYDPDLFSPCPDDPLVDCWQDGEASLNAAGALIAFASDRCSDLGSESHFEHPCLFLYDRSTKTLTTLPFGDSNFEPAIR